MSHAGELNDAQKKAVLHKNGALLILAGAGAGKTRVITHRIAELIRGGVAPEAILAVTFTNKAASEMRDRIFKLLREDLALSPYDTPKTLPYIGTFHAVCLEIIKTFHEKAGLPRRFSIYDRSDSVRALKEAITAAGFDPKQLEPRRVLSVTGRHKGNAVDLPEFREKYARSYIDEAIAEVWGRYEKILAKEKVLDFDDILLRAYQLVSRNPDVLAYFQNAWHYIHVDEYQDTNRVQYELVRLLAKKSGNIAAVGDIDQNIYSWRGASIEFIMNFEQDFPSAEIVVLAENYRSTKTILAAANDAIVKNIRRKEKELYTQNPDGEKITVAGFYDETEEARYIAKEAKYLTHYGVKSDDIAVLYRANFQSRILEEAFLKENVPYQVLGTRFFERKEVKDAVAYIKLALNPDSSADFARAIASPSRGVGKVTLVKVINGKESELPATAKKKIHDFRTLIKNIGNKIDSALASEAIRYSLNESGLWNLYAKGSAEDTERLENLKELVTVATKYDTLSAPLGIEKLLEECALQSDQDELKEKKTGVKLMTIHAAKGLEFERVFITGLEEGLFPHERDNAEGVDDEEERRLFYVALTRAEKKVYLTHAATRRIFGNRSINVPSEFVSEIDPSLVEVIPFIGTYHEETIN
jgi:DNA helicase-2/ATP-dependent DNA helicase PcrA